jgi:hypothetical protein
VAVVNWYLRGAEENLTILLIFGGSVQDRTMNQEAHGTNSICPGRRRPKTRHSEPRFLRDKSRTYTERAVRTHSIILQGFLSERLCAA